jgi:hypothetical protein
VSRVKESSIPGWKVSLAIATGAAFSALLGACGGGATADSKVSTPSARFAPTPVPATTTPRGAASVTSTDPFNGDDPLHASELLLAFGEQHFTSIFPAGSTTTFDYEMGGLGTVARARCYSTGWCLGVMQQQVGSFVRGDVVVRGPQGSGYELDVDVGPLLGYVTPPAPQVFASVPATAATNFAWFRSIDGNPLSTATPTKVWMFDANVRLTQLSSHSEFIANSADWASFSLAPPGDAPGLFVTANATTPTFRAGYVQQVGNRTMGYTGTLDTSRCEPVQGAYVVHEVVYGDDGVPTKLAADFSAQCSLGRAATYASGAIRYHSTLAAALDKTFAVGGVDRFVNEGQALRLDGALSWNPSSRLKSLDWVQLSGPAFDLSACTFGVCDTYAPLVQKGGAQALFRLTATAESGQVSTADLKVQVRSWQDQQSRADVWGNGYVAGGSDLRMSESDGQFAIPLDQGSEAIYADQTKERIQWTFYPNMNGGDVIVPPTIFLSTAAGTPLKSGAYSGDIRDGFTPGPTPSADFQFDGHGCNSPLWDARVAALDRNSTDYSVVNHAAVMLAVRCVEGGGEIDASYARFWIRYTPVLPPVVKIAAPATASAGQPFVVQDAGSATPAGPEWLRSCKQVFGPAATLTFLADGGCQVTPGPDTTNHSKLVITYEIIDALGQSGVGLAELTVTGGPAAVTSRSPAAARQKFGAAFQRTGDRHAR